MRPPTQRPLVEDCIPVSLRHLYLQERIVAGGFTEGEVPFCPGLRFRARLSSDGRSGWIEIAGFGTWQITGLPIELCNRFGIVNI
jgi:hypothetical protein